MIEKMTRFEFFESGAALTGARMGIVPIDMLVKYDVYKEFRTLICAGVAKPQAIQKAAKSCKCNRSTVARYIYWFERDDPAFQHTAQESCCSCQMATFVSK